MNYIMLIYESEHGYEQRRHPQNDAFWGPWRRYNELLLEAGILKGGAPLEPIATATTIRVRGGEKHVQDGPYADTKEQLGGFMFFDAPSLDVALAWAAKCPAAAYGTVEVRPIADLEHIFGQGSQSITPQRQRD